MASRISLAELLEKLEKTGGLPDEIRKAVEAARKEAQRDIRTTLRDECRLQLRKPDMPLGPVPDEADAPLGRPAYIRIPVTVRPGCPAGVVHLKIDVSSEEIERALLLASYREALEKIKSGGPKASELNEILRDSGHLNLSGLPSLQTQSINAVTAWASACLAWLNETAEAITGRILLVDEDCMGAYYYNGDEEARIELYWGVIGLIAKLHGWSVRDLAIKVLTHEWAHAFTHLGLDVDEEHWSMENFRDTDKFVKEGLAQYYTYWTLGILSDRNKRLYDGAFLVYEKLLPKQHAAYQAHLPWINGYKSEHVRHSMLGLRRSGETSLKEFEHRLANVKNDWKRERKNTDSPYRRTSQQPKPRL